LWPNVAAFALSANWLVVSFGRSGSGESVLILVHSSCVKIPSTRSLPPVVEVVEQPNAPATSTAAHTPRFHHMAPSTRMKARRYHNGLTARLETSARPAPARGSIRTPTPSP